MKIALGQINVVCNNPEQNFEKMKEMINQARDAKVDLIVFSEMCIGGYFLMDKYLDHDYCEYLHSFNEKVKNLSDDIGIIFGNLYYDDIYGIKHGRDGRKARYNAALFAYNKKWVKKANNALDGIHIKHLNPDYRVFDDSRYFLSGLETSEHLFKCNNALISPFIFKRNNETIKIGLEVCEDMWSSDYTLDVTGEYAKQDVDLFINISSSPYTLNKENSRHKRIKEHALQLKDKMKPFIYVNNVGMQNNGKNVLTFDGGSCVYNQAGNKVFTLNDEFKEELKVIDDKPLIQQDNHNKVLNALICAIKEFDQQIFNSRFKWVIGISGGIDSSINAALLVKALGSERVIGYNMASNYNSLKTINNAKVLCKNLNIELREGSIEEVNRATLNTLKTYGYEGEFNSLTYENIQARIRGHLLSSFASVENGVIVNNANKIEIALGYCTLYGDSIGAISPIGDLTKVQIFDLAKALNEDFKKEVVPYSLIPEIVNDEIKWDMPPSAELKEKQVDPMKWYYHDLLINSLLEYPTGNIESLLEDYLSGEIYQKEIGKWIKYYRLDNGEKFIEDLEWVLKTMNLAVFKRIQMPPMVLISRGAFGNDYREAQLGFIRTKRYQELKEKIIKRV